MVHPDAPLSGAMVRETDGKRNKMTTRASVSPPSDETCHEAVTNPNKMTTFKNLEMSIDSPTDKDVLLGHASYYLRYPGNTRFRSLVDEYAVNFHESHWRIKQKFAKCIVGEIQANGGRFLTKFPNHDGWLEILDKWAIQKTLQALRNKSKSVILKTKEQTRLQDPSSHGAANQMTMNMSGLTEKDVLLGNDGYHSEFPGNKWFQSLIDEQISNCFRYRHLAGTGTLRGYAKAGPVCIKHARSVVKILHANGGRFMKELPNKIDDWFEVPYGCAVEMAQQALQYAYSVDMAQPAQRQASWSENTGQRGHDQQFIERVNVIQNNQPGDGLLEWEQEQMSILRPPPFMLQPTKPMTYSTVKVIYECPHSNKTHYEVRTLSRDPSLTLPPPPPPTLLHPPSIPCHPPPMFMNNGQFTSMTTHHENYRHQNEHEYNCVHQMHVGHHDEREDWAPYYHIEQEPQLEMDNMMMNRHLPIQHRERADPPYGHFSPTPNEYYL